MSAQLSVAGEAILLREDRDGSRDAALVLNRPTQFNALSAEMLSALQAALDAIKDDDTVRCVVLATSGKAFCAGHDLKADARQSAPGLLRNSVRPMQPRHAVHRRSPGPRHRPCSRHGDGRRLPARRHCDLAVASESATFAVSGINVGLFCSTPAVALSRNVSPSMPSTCW